MSGAADYIPKAKISSELLESVEGVLAITAGHRPHQRLSHCLRYEELRYELDNDVLLIPPLGGATEAGGHGSGTGQQSR